MARKNEAHETVIDSLTEALLQLMEKKLLAEINISELCKRAGVSRVSFYRNYASLQDILVHHLTKCTDDWWLEFSKRDEDEFNRSFLTELIAQYRQNKKLIMLIYKNNAAYLLKEHIFECCRLGTDMEPDEAYARAVLAGAIYGVVDEWIRRGMEELPMDFSLRKVVFSMPEMEDIRP